MKRTITTPIFLLKISGNHKEAAASSKFTTIASYEPHINQTYIVVDVSGEYTGEAPLKDSVLHHYSGTLGVDEEDFLSAQYSESGIDFITK